MFHALNIWMRFRLQMLRILLLLPSAYRTIHLLFSHLAEEQQTAHSGAPRCKSFFVPCKCHPGSQVRRTTEARHQGPELDQSISFAGPLDFVTIGSHKCDDSVGGATGVQRRSRLKPPKPAFSYVATRRSVARSPTSSVSAPRERAPGWSGTSAWV